jgi:large subunit ribosomal protein L4
MAGLTAPVLGGKKTVALADETFGLEVNGPLLHEVVKAEQAAHRAGTHATKTRGQVRGGGVKPYRQKGTGRARQGTIRAPQFRTGGVVFGPSPRSYAVKVNRKAARKARAIALSQHANAGSLGVFDASSFSAPKTKDAIALVGGWRTELPLLVVVALGEFEAALSFRNLPRTLVVAPHELEVRDLLWARSLLVSQAALDELTTRGRTEEVAS